MNDIMKEKIVPALMYVFIGIMVYLIGRTMYGMYFSGYEIEYEEYILAKDITYNVEIKKKDKAISKGEFTYEVEDESVARISKSGLLTPVDVGTTNVVIKSKKYKNTYKVALTVFDITKASFELLENETTMLVKDEKKIPIYVNASRDAIYKLDFSSSDEKIATINEFGVIRALSEGVTTITFNDNNGNEISYKVTVENYKKVEDEEDNKESTNLNEIKVKTINYQISKTSLVVGDIVDIKTSVLPSNASNNALKFTSDNEEVAIVSEDGKIEALKEGKAIIKIEATDSSNVSRSITITVKESSTK